MRFCSWWQCTVLSTITISASFLTLKLTAIARFMKPAVLKRSPRTAVVNNPRVEATTTLAAGNVDTHELLSAQRPDQSDPKTEDSQEHGLQHLSPSWTRGHWVARTDTVLPYVAQNCGRFNKWIARWNIMLLSQMNADYKAPLLWLPGETAKPVKEVRHLPLVNPLLKLELEEGPWTMPSSYDIQRIIEGRQLAFFGDSIGGQQSLSFALLFACSGINSSTARAPMSLQGSKIDFPGIHASANILTGGQFLGFSEIKERKTKKQMFYIDDAGQKKEIRDKMQDHIINIRKTECPHALMAYVSSTENLTLMINSGRWFGYKRYDVKVFDGDVALDFTKPDERLRYFSLVVKRLAECLEAHFAKRSYAIWIGANPRPTEVDLYCGESMHPWTKPISDGIKGLKRNFLIDPACAGGPRQGMKRRSSPVDIHWQMPGVPDLTNTFIFRLMLEKGREMA